VIAAAGQSERMGGVDKMMALIGAEPVLARVVSVFQGSALIDRISLVVSEENLAEAERLARDGGWAKVSVLPGGRRRQDSVVAGLERLADCAWAVIHDGARPLVSEGLIRRGLEAAEETGAAVAAIPVIDTIKLAGEDRLVRETPPRECLWAVQTPQVFRYGLITEAYRRLDGEVTDDAAAVERLGGRVRLYPGAYDNIKITAPLDLEIAEVLWRRHGE
jgi:2-C-methyl-D-erythritol 4-phosphate cytidylyltransferase